MKKQQFVITHKPITIAIDVMVKGDERKQINTFKLDCKTGFADTSLFDSALKNMSSKAMRGYGQVFTEVADYIEKNKLTA